MLFYAEIRSQMTVGRFEGKKSDDGFQKQLSSIFVLELNLCYVYSRISYKHHKY